MWKVAGIGVGMFDDEKARAGLFREVFAEQLKIVEIERQIATQPLDNVSGFHDLAEVAVTTAELHKKLGSHERRLTNLRLKI